MATEILMPALSPTMEEGTLAKWLVKEGQAVKSGMVIAEIETDKATMEFEAVDEGVTGVIASVAGLITGAANDGGFKGLAGRFERRGLLRFGVAMAGEIRFTRLDNGSSVELAHFPQAVPRPTGLADLMRNALAPQADAATRDAFAEAWQGWVRTILIEHADDPALITENP